MGFQLSHSSSRRSCQEQEQGGLVSSCWSISRAKWFFKPSSGQLKFHGQALGERCRQVNFQPKLLLYHCPGRTSHPPAGDFQPKNILNAPPGTKTLSTASPNGVNLLNRVRSSRQLVPKPPQSSIPYGPRSPRSPSPRFPTPTPPARSTYLRDLSTLSSLPEGLAPGDSFRRRKIPSRFFMSLALERRASVSGAGEGTRGPPAPRGPSEIGRAHV